MATYGAMTKTNAKMKARTMRKKGYETSVYKKKTGKPYGISVTRK